MAPRPKKPAPPPAAESEEPLRLRARRGLVVRREREEAEAREQLYIAETAYTASGHKSSGIPWVAEARLRHGIAQRRAFEAREDLRRAEIAHEEEERRR